MRRPKTLPERMRPPHHEPNISRSRWTKIGYTVKSFNGKFRDECLNDNVFTTLAQARRIIESWRVDYNENRPHRSLGQKTPKEFAADQHRMLPALHV